MSNIIQYDTSKNVVGGVNIAEATQSDNRLVFNESYTVTGKILSVPSIYACYDLTVVGDMEADDIDVRGNLYVRGNIKAKRLSCLKSIICSGDIDVEAIFSNEIVANDIVCHTVSCSGNIVARTAIDISKSLISEKSVMAGEEILGSGQFSAKNASAAEYFDFNGEVVGKVIELETDASFGEPHPVTSEEETFDALSQKFHAKIKEKLQKVGDVNEDELVEFVKQLSDTDKGMLSDWKFLTANLVELSYLDKITNFRDYLIAVMAAKMLPEEIVGYETLAHVFDSLMLEAEKNLDELPFRAKTIEDFAYALRIVTLCENELRIDKDEALEKIFQSVGIKYKTVKGYLG